MNKKQRITATNIVRHYLKKLGCHIESVDFKISKDGDVDMFVKTVEELPCTLKNYTVKMRCEDRLIKKYDILLYVNFKY